MYLTLQLINLSVYYGHGRPDNPQHTTFLSLGRPNPASHLEQAHRREQGLGDRVGRAVRDELGPPSRSISRLLQKAGLIERGRKEAQWRPVPPFVPSRSGENRGLGRATTGSTWEQSLDRPGCLLEKRWLLKRN